MNVWLPRGMIMKINKRKKQLTVCYSQIENYLPEN